MVMYIQCKRWFFSVFESISFELFELFNNECFIVNLKFLVTLQFFRTFFFVKSSKAELVKVRHSLIVVRRQKELENSANHSLIFLSY